MPSMLSSQLSDSAQTTQPHAGILLIAPHTVHCIYSQALIGFLMFVLRGLFHSYALPLVCSTDMTQTADPARPVPRVVNIPR